MDNINIWDFDFDANYIWTFSDEYKAIFRTHIYDEKTELLKLFYTNEIGSYRGIKHYCGKIYLAPQNGTKEILVYDIEADSIKKLKISDKFLPQGEQHNLFIQIIQWRNKLFFIPGRYEAVICLDIETDVVTYIFGWIDEFRNLLLSENNGLVIFNGVSQIDENSMLLIGWKADVIVVLDMENMSCKKVEFGSSFGGLRGSVKVNDKYWISYKERTGLFIATDTKIEKECFYELQGRLFCYKECIYIVSTRNTTVYVINKNSTDRIERCIDLKEKGQRNPFLIAKQYHDVLLLLYSEKRIFILYNMQTGNYRKVNYSDMDKFRLEIMLDMNKGLLVENERLGLDDFLKLI